MSEPLMKNQYIGLKTIYHTPHVCGNCLEHIGDNWLYCPECGTQTELTSQDYEETQALLHEQEEKQ